MSPRQQFCEALREWSQDTEVPNSDLLSFIDHAGRLEEVDKLHHCSSTLDFLCLSEECWLDLE